MHQRQTVKMMIESHHIQFVGKPSVTAAQEAVSDPSAGCKPRVAVVHAISGHQSPRQVRTAWMTLVLQA